MKSIITLTLLFVLATTSFAQQLSVSKHVLTKTDYLQKSKRQNKTGLVFLTAGAGLIITSVVIPKGELVEDNGCIGPYCDTKYKNDGLKSGFFIAGGVSALGSIPFFIASGKNKKKANAASAFLDIQKIPVLQQMGISNHSIPVLGLKISL